MEITGADGPRRRGDGAEWMQDPSGDEPAQSEGDHRHDAERDPVADQKMVELGVVRINRVLLESVSLRGHLRPRQSGRCKRSSLDMGEVLCPVGKG